MDGFRVTESLDSLWFFSNVLSSSSQALGSTNGENTTPELVKEFFTEQPPEPISETLQNRPSQSPLSAKWVRSCPGCGASEADEVEPAKISESVESPSSTEKEETIRKRIRKRSSKCRRKILGELDLCYDGMEISHEPAAWIMFEGDVGYYQQLGGLFGHYKNMPPLNDNMAMKEHLKLWAYAVACTVR